MRRVSLVRPLENVESREEMAVLAVLDHLSPMLSYWQETESRERELENLRNELDRSKKRYSNGVAYRSVLELQAARNLFSVVPFFSLIFIFCGLLCAGISILRGGYIPGVVLGGACLSIGLTKARRAAFVHRYEVDARKREHNKSLADNAQVVSTMEAHISSVEAEIAQRAQAFPEIRLAPVRFLMTLQTISGLQVMLDTAGTDGGVGQALTSHLVRADGFLADRVKAGWGGPVDTAPAVELSGNPQTISRLCAQFDSSYADPGLSKQSLLPYELPQGSSAEDHFFVEALATWSPGSICLLCGHLAMPPPLGSIRSLTVTDESLDMFSSDGRARRVRQALDQRRFRLLEPGETVALGKAAAALASRGLLPALGLRMFEDFLASGLLSKLEE